MTMLSPGPPSRMSCRARRSARRRRAAPDSVVSGTADQLVVAVAAVGRELDGVGRQAGSVDRVVAGQGVDHQAIGGLGAADVDLGGQSEDGNAGRIAGDHTTSSPLVPLTMTVSAWPSPRPKPAGEVDVDSPVSAAQVVDGDRVGAAQGVEVDPLHVVEVHRDVAEVAGEPDPPAIGGDVEVLV